MTPTERMYYELDRQGKKGADLCRHLGINTSILAGWKSQNTIPPAKYLVSIAEFLNVTVDYLLTGNDASHEIPHDRSFGFKFPALFAALLKDRNISNYKAAKDLGVSQSTIKNWTDGTTFPDTQKLYEICKYFGVSADYLVGFSDRPTPFDLSKEQIAALEEHTKTVPSFQISADELFAKLPPDIREPFAALYELAVYKYEQENKE